MSLFPFMRDGGVDSDTVVGDAHDQIVCVRESDLQATAAGMGACIADRLTPDAIHNTHH
jgi:hypothetical protein